MAKEACSSSSSLPVNAEEETLFGSESGWVEARTHCDHLASLSADLIHIPTPHTPCNRCQHPDTNWLCLCCKVVLCSRYVNKHMLQHFRRKNHSLALGFSDLSVWCFSCGAYLDAQVILPLRAVYETAYMLKFGEAPPLRTVGQPMKAIEDSYALTKASTRTPRLPASAIGESSSAHSNSRIPPPPSSSTYMQPPPPSSSTYVQPPPPPQPRCRTLNDKVNELGAFAEYQNQFMHVIGEYMASMDSLLRGMAIYLGMEPTLSPPPVALPPPFQFQYSYPDPWDNPEGTRKPDENEK